MARSEHTASAGRAPYHRAVPRPDTDERLAGIDPDELAITLKVLRQVPLLDPDHEDVRTMKRAASYMYKLIKKQRRAEIRLERQRHDQDIIEKTATGSPMRIDDETAGIPLVSTAQRLRR